MKPRSVETPCRAGEHCDDGLLATLGCATVLTLDRGAGVALTDAVRRLLAARMSSCGVDPGAYGLAIRSVAPGVFCDGLDLAELHGLAPRSAEGAVQVVKDCYDLIWRLECFNKPTVALIDGWVRGYGVGFTAFGTHRVAGEHFELALPGTRQGYFPDAGIAFLLARMPRQIGVYLGLTGRAIGRADAYRLGVVTHCIGSAQFGAILAAFADADPIDPVLDDRHEDPGVERLAPHEDVIERCFSADTVEEILARLRAEPRDREWCAGVAADLARCCPLSLKVALRHIRRAGALDLRQTLIVDCRIAQRLLSRADLALGLRAQSSNENGSSLEWFDVPWRPQRLEDVSETMVDAVFAAMPGGELVLPTVGEI